MVCADPTWKIARGLLKHDELSVLGYNASLHPTLNTPWNAYCIPGRKVALPAADEVEKPVDIPVPACGTPA